MSIIKDNNITIKKTDGSEVVITGALSTEILEKHKPEALKFFSENLSLDGFRKGNIPEAVIKKNISETALLEEIASRALNALYPKIIREEKLDVFDRPRVNFTKLAPGNPVEFTITTSLMPKIELADYKKIAKKLNSEKVKVELEEKEVEQALLEVRKELDRRENLAKEASDEKKPTEETTDSTPKSEKESVPSPLTDEKVQAISPMKTVAEFEKSVREDLKKHKENQADEKHRLAIMEAILKESTITLPEMIIQSELQSMIAQFSADVEQTGIKMDEYLKQAGKTEEELFKEWRPHAENRAKMQLILNKIAVAEELLPKKEDVEHQVLHILEDNPKVDKSRAEVYVETQLANANVFSFLEEQK